MSLKLFKRNIKNIGKRFYLFCSDFCKPEFQYNTWNNKVQLLYLQLFLIISQKTIFKEKFLITQNLYIRILIYDR